MSAVQGAPAAFGRRLQRIPGKVRAWQLSRVDPGPPDSEVLAPRDAVRENGFTVFRGLFPAQECAALAAEFKDRAGIVEGKELTRVDSTNKYDTSRRVLLDERVLGAVRQVVGPQPRFLQVSDLHYRHDTAGWHRDSVHRASDSSDSADWTDGKYNVVKAILYLESENAALGVIPGSHQSPLAIDKEMIKALERFGGSIVIGEHDEPNRRMTAKERGRPVVWKAEVGDVLVFDQRMYHAGRRVEDGRVSDDLSGAKLSLSFVFGDDNAHSERMWSYFRYARTELHFADYKPDFRAQLAEHGLVLGSGLRNYYLDHPQELRLAHLRNPETLEPLIERFTRDGAKG